MIWLLQNWRLVAVGLLVAVPSLYGFAMKHQRDSARATIAEMTVAARIQEERTKAEIQRQKTITEELDRAHKKTAARIGADNARLRDELRDAASRSIVPATPETAGSGDDDPVACFDRGAINRELAGVLQRHAERLGAIALAGENTAEAFAVCQSWAMKQAQRPAPTP